MNYAIIRVGKEHHGPLIPGTLIIVGSDAIAEMDRNNPLGSSVFFENPVGGYSSGKLLTFTTAEQDARIEN